MGSRPYRRVLAGVLVGSALAAVGVASGTVGAGSLSAPAVQVALPFSAAQFLDHWWIFPASVAFSFVALAAGVSGALFFSPFFMLVVGLTPAQAIGAGLLTEVFGMGNGLANYVRQGVVDYATAKWLLLGSVPAIVVGAFAAHRVDPTLLKLAFGVGLLALGGFLALYPSAEECEPGESEGEYLRERAQGNPETVVEAADGEVYRYTTCWRAPGVALSGLGGFVTGLISAGLPEIVTTQLVVRCRLPPRVAIATSVFVLAITAAVGAAIHALSATPVWYVVAWSVPGVLVGGTVGTRVGKYLPEDLMETGLGVVFGVVGGIVLAVELLA
ncbi:sulfite exporter TauE/SafE family protein [Natronomonas marina]|jgi:uncharacterized membrane protein YfcA|uniref:sulfite exporter TauE/SafE family protein n=1 Tax=Natronomonas marina TaxID=2961939 RepID=UPI0020C9B886|nr:sulfite exporter TauE/SafE family protein [Natronomonas marina]